jgi:integrase
MTRRRWGALRKVERKGRKPIWLASYEPPDEARREWPSLPKKISKSFPLAYQTQAEKWLGDAETSIRLGAWTPPDVSRNESKAQETTFREYAIDWANNHKRSDGKPISQTTRDKYEEYFKNHLFPAFGDLPLSQISYKRVRDWYDSWQIGRDGSGASGRKHVAATLHAILETAATQPLDDEGTTLLKENPMRAIRNPKVRTRVDYVIAEPQELEDVIAAIEPKYQLAIMLGGDRDMRIGEICGLQRKNIDFERMKIHVRTGIKSIRGEDGHRKLVLGSLKTDNSERDIDIPKYLVEPLQQHLRLFTGEGDDGMLFTAPRTKGYLAPQQLRSAWYRARKAVPRLEREGMRFHDLRHTALTRMMENGAGFGYVKEQGGHSTEAVSAIYQQVSEGHRRKVLANLEKSMGKPAASHVSPIIGLLDVMQPTAIAAALANMSEEQKKQILAVLPPETVQEVLLSLLQQ